MVGVTPTFNPAVCALSWALVTNGALLRVVVGSQRCRPQQDWRCGHPVLDQVSCYVFCFPVDEWSQTHVGGDHWGVRARLAGAAEAIAVFSFAAFYITWGHPITGVPGLVRDRILERWEVDKAFHDTAVGMSIGQTFTPFFHKTFEMVCLAGRLETALYPPRNENHAQDMAYKQDFEVAAAIIYCLLLATPTPPSSTPWCCSPTRPSRRSRPPRQPTTAVATTEATTEEATEV